MYNVFIILLEDTMSNLNEDFILACKNTDLVKAKDLLLNPHYHKEVDIHYKQDLALLYACYSGDLEVVRFLLSSPELKEHADIHVEEDSPLLHAVQEGHYDLVRYLLTSSELTEHANIHAQKDYALMIACEKEHIEILDFLLNSQQLNDRINLLDNLKNVYLLLDGILDNMKDQKYAYIHGDNYGNKLVKYLTCDAELEKNTNPLLDDLIDGLVKYDKDFYEIYKTKKAAWDLNQSLSINSKTDRKHKL